MVEDGIHTVRKVKQSDNHPDKDTVILEGGSFPFFRTDHGELEAGDRVRVKDGSYAGRAPTKPHDPEAEFRRKRREKRWNDRWDRNHPR